MSDYQAHHAPAKLKNFSWAPSTPWLQRCPQSCAVILAINWVFQGVRGMESKELSFRVILEALVGLLLMVALLAQGLGFALSFLLAAFGAHSFNYFFNGQFWVCARYCQNYRHDPRKIDGFLERTAATILAMPSIKEAVCIGSQGMASGTRTSRSDIDLRIVFDKGFKNWLVVNWTMLKWRTRSLLLRVPLDLYGYDSLRALDRFDQDEPLLVIKDDHHKIRQRYFFRELHFSQ